MVTLTAQIVGHVVTTATEGHRNFFEIVLTAKWWADNIGQIFGAAFGAGISYFVGFGVATREDRRTDVRVEQNRLMHLGFFYDDTAQLRDEIKANLLLKQAQVEKGRGCIIYVFPNTASPFAQLSTKYHEFREYFTRPLSDAAIRLFEMHKLMEPYYAQIGSRCERQGVNDSKDGVALIEDEMTRLLRIIGNALEALRVLDGSNPLPRA